MKNSGKGSRKASGDLIRVIAAVLTAIAISVILGTGPAMAADDGSTPPDTAAGQSLLARILADHALTAEVLAILVAVALTFAYGRHRRSVNARRSAHARVHRQAHVRAGSGTRVTEYFPAGDRAAGRGRSATDGDPWMALPPRQPATPPWPAAASARHAVGQPLHADDYPSWPGRPGPYALHPDHPSWPGRPDPRWAATEAALQAGGYPGWPAPHSPPWREAEPSADNGEPGWPGGAGPAARREPPPAAAAPLVLAAPVRTSFAPRADAAPPAVIRPPSGPMRQESPAGVIDRVRPAAANRVQPERVQVWDAGSVELATWIISEANQQAADIRHEARDQMAASVADAKHEAAELVRKASEQATATVAAAELEAAEIRATVTQLSAELGGVAAQITENLVSFATPGTKPLTRPAIQPVATPTVPPVATPTPEPVTQPEARPAARPAAQPGTKPTSRPAGKPGTRPAAKPGTGSARSKRQPRQLVAFRVAAVATAALFLFALISGVTEVGLHGFPFFVFRATGTGETGPTGLQEDQGPGQPDAPKPTPTQIKVKPSPHSTVTVSSGQ
jgi:hypothetical protein